MNNQLNDLFVSYKPVQVTNYPYIEQPSQTKFIDDQENTQDKIGDFLDTLQLPITKQFAQKSNQGFAGWKPLTNNQSNQNNNLANMSFEDLVKTYNLPIQISSGYRGKNGFRGGKTKSGKQSNHNKVDEHGHPMAYDIQPLVNGKVDKSDSAFANLRNILANNQNVREWFRIRNWGILDETTSQMMAKTGATGKHFHIGPDSAAVRFS